MGNDDIFDIYPETTLERPLYTTAPESSLRNPYRSSGSTFLYFKSPFDNCSSIHLQPLTDDNIPLADSRHNSKPWHHRSTSRSMRRHRASTSMADSTPCDHSP